MISSVGRALRLHRRCREFESLITHHVDVTNNTNDVRLILHPPKVCGTHSLTRCVLGLRGFWRSPSCRMTRSSFAHFELPSEFLPDLPCPAPKKPCHSKRDFGLPTVFRARRTDEAQITIYGRADCRGPAETCGRGESPGTLPQARQVGRGALQVEGQAWRQGSSRTPAPQGSESRADVPSG